MFLAIPSGGSSVFLQELRGCYEIVASGADLVGGNCRGSSVSEIAGEHQPRQYQMRCGAWTLLLFFLPGRHFLTAQTVRVSADTAEKYKNTVLAEKYKNTVLGGYRQEK
jgi:hypothetical protein